MRCSAPVEIAGCGPRRSSRWAAATEAGRSKVAGGEQLIRSRTGCGCQRTGRVGTRCPSGGARKSTGNVQIPACFPGAERPDSLLPPFWWSRAFTLPRIAAGSKKRSYVAGVSTRASEGFPGPQKGRRAGLDWILRTGHVAINAGVGTEHDPGALVSDRPWTASEQARWRWE